MKGKIFNAQEVQAIIAGNMTMFREVIKPQPNEQQKHIHKTTFSQNKEEIGNVFLSNHSFADFISRKVAEERIKCPYQVGQKIFCKESFCLDPRGGILYKTLLLTHDLPKEYAPQWKPAQHMKQEHSRLTLQIKEIRVERLQDISEEDAIAEGFKNTFVGFQHPVYNPGRTANQDFEIFWNKTHKKPEEKFEASPFCWVISFEVVND